MTERDRAIVALLLDAIEARDAEAFCELWRRFAEWHGLNPDFAAVLQERQAQDAAGVSRADRLKAIVAEQLFPSSSVN